MRRWPAVLSVVLAATLGGAGSLWAQTRADSAAVLLHAVEQLRLRGETEAIRAVLEYIERQYAGTAAAAEVPRVRLALRRAPAAERAGRTEMMVWGASYGAWLGVAVPIMFDSDAAEAYGVGLLLGAPAGFAVARSYARATQLTEGQARAITFGSSWGTYQGFGWAEALDLGVRRAEWCWPDEYYDCTEAHVPTRVALGVLGGLAGIGTGAVLARRPITIGTAAAVNSSALWGTWLGWGLSYIGGLEDDALLTSTLVAGNAALLAAGFVAPGWEVSESRVRLVSIGGVIGGLAGLGLLLIVQPEDDKVAVAFPLVGSALGLAAGVHGTREGAAESAGAGGDGMGMGPGAAGAATRGALVNRDGGRWTFDIPDAAVTMQRVPAGVRPAAYVPLVRARW
jgi:hypothetical protein